MSLIIDSDKPHLTNLNEDPFLTQKVLYGLLERLTVGRKIKEKLE